MPNDAIGFQIIQLAHLKKGRDDALFKAETGIGLTQFRLLKLLSMAPGLGAGQLARWLLITPQSTAALITEAWKAGLVTKEKKKKSGERVRVGLTSEGRRMLRRCSPVLKLTERETRMRLTEEESATFARLLVTVAQCYLDLIAKS
jgi:DNA-binding MarR family transcriptional regulator